MVATALVVTAAAIIVKIICLSEPMPFKSEYYSSKIYKSAYIK